MDHLTTPQQSVPPDRNMQGNWRYSSVDHIHTQVRCVVGISRPVAAEMLDKIRAGKQELTLMNEPSQIAYKQEVPGVCSPKESKYTRS